MAIFYTAVILLFGVLSFFTINKISAEQLDMVEVNNSFKQIEAILDDSSRENWKEISEELENQYECTILFYDDSNYQSRLLECLKKGDVVLDYEHDGKLLAKISFVNTTINFEEQKEALMRIVLVAISAIWFLGMVLFVYFYMGYVRPFHKLKNFAGEVARGNLDMPLSMTKSNYFGVFTESFDIMREELRRAKENEYKANVSKKELVAELSHDIKTPIATIKAACEVIEVKSAKSEGIGGLELHDKVQLIEKKADVVEQLINNMFHATLEELEVLKVEPQEELSTCIDEMFKELQVYGNIHIENQIPQCLLWMDKLRMVQVIDNIVNNAMKYAKTDVHISYSQRDNGILIRIMDDGPGVPEEDLAKVSEKFYRGSNVAGENGSGLGLYLTKMFMEKMEGQMNCYNDNGFVVELFLRKSTVDMQ
ncbi:MAG: HAMP domain-containing sensor histidine kinase [Lachnobacterium sp.]|nr:HAMP domain-containing sensor histidine kinase [Lachnobacterium sp.]